MRFPAFLFVLLLIFGRPIQGWAQTPQFVAQAQALFQSAEFEVRLDGGPTQSNGYRSQVTAEALLYVLGRDPSRFEAFAQLAQSISSLPDLPASHWLFDGLHQFLGRLERQPDSVSAPIRERIARGLLNDLLSNVSRSWLEVSSLGAAARWRGRVALPAFLLTELRRHPEWIDSSSSPGHPSLSRLLERAEFSRMSSVPGQSGHVGANWLLLLGGRQAASVLRVNSSARRSYELATIMLVRLGSRVWLPEGEALDQWIEVLSSVIRPARDQETSGVPHPWAELLDRLLLLPGAERSFEVVRQNLSSQREELRNLSDHSRGSIHRLLAVLDRRPLGEDAQLAPWQESRERRATLIEQDGTAWIESLRIDPRARAGWLASFQETLSTLWGYRDGVGLARWARLLSPYSRELPELSQTIQSLLTSRSPGERQLGLAEAFAPWIERAPELRRTLLNQLQDLPSLATNTWLRARLAVALGGVRVGSVVPERVIADLASLGDREAILTFGSDLTSEQAIGRMIEALLSSTQRSSDEAHWLSNRFRARLLESPEALRALFEHWVESRSILTQSSEGEAIERFLLSALDSSPELIQRYLRALEAISATSTSMGAVAVTRAPGFSAAGPMAIADQESMRVQGVLQRNLPTVLRALLRNPIQPSRLHWILAHWNVIHRSEELRALLAERIREFDPRSEERWAESPIRELFLRSLASPSLAIRQAAILALESLSTRPSMGVLQSGSAGPQVAPNRSSRDLEPAPNTRNSQRTALSLEILGDATIQRSLLSSSRESAQHFPNLARRLFDLSRAQPPANSSVAFEVGRHQAALQNRGNSASIWGCTLREAAYRLTHGSTQGVELP